MLSLTQTNLGLFSQMNSLGKPCTEIKRKYDDCFQSWFKDKFLTGEGSEQYDQCSHLYKLYRQCLEACRALKEEYDACFNIWFSQKFLKGEHNDAMCAPLLKVYKQCVEKSMKENHIEMKEIDLDHLGTEREQKVPPKPA